MNGENERASGGQHSLILENRSKLMISGVRDVLSFDENEIELMTEQGGLAIRGEGLEILNLSRDTGELDVCGKVYELIYSVQKQEPKRLFSRFLK